MNADTYEWQESAVCAQMDPDLWHRSPSDGGNYPMLKRICQRCPVLNECTADVLRREWGQALSERRGVWAGMTTAARVKAEAQLRKATGVAA